MADYNSRNNTPASRIEAALVKTPHPIGEITTHIASATDRFVRLMREDGASTNGDASTSAQTCLLSPNEVSAAVVQALEAPLGFPPLAAGIVPGDRVAIAVDESVPCVGVVVR